MGRLCLENYANVGRTCVFSHEELVMKMVTVAHKLSIGWWCSLFFFQKIPKKW